MPHIHEKIDFTAEVFIVFNNKVLLRKHDKYKMWLSVGGHVELDEDPNQAAVREVKEEIGLDVVLYDGNKLFNKETDTYHELIPPMFMNRHTISDTHQHITLTYFATTSTDQTTPDSEVEVSEELKWFTAEELNDPQYDITDNVKYYAHEALNILSQ
jgi:8-oxo-dGTP pyrophosphatase MutT (NUDIX family)